MMSKPSRRAFAAVISIVLAVSFVVLAPVVLAGTAVAHDELVSAVPADGSSAQHLPREGSLTFAEQTAPADLQVSADGRRLPVTAVPGDSHALRYSLAGVSEKPTVVIAWTVVDQYDGHRSGGAVRVHLTGTHPSTTTSNRAAGAAAGPADPDPTGLQWLDRGSRGVGFLAMVLLVGGLLFVALLWPEGTQVARTRRLLVTAVGLGILAAAGAIEVVVWRGSQASIKDALSTDYGRAATSSLLLWLLAAIVVAGVLQRDTSAVRGIAWRLGAVVVSVALIRIEGINAHATQTAQRTLGAIADFLHLVAVSSWVGGLVVLSVCVLPRARLEDIEKVVPRFSRVALIAVATIVTSGLLLLWNVSRGIDGFWSTHYSHVLIIKLSLFSLVILAAMKSKRWVETTLAEVVSTHRRTAVRSFAVSVAAETVLVIATLAAASVLVTSSPGR